MGNTCCRRWTEARSGRAPRAHGVPDVLRNLEIAPHGLGVPEPETENLSLHEQRETGVGGFRNELLARLGAASARLTCVEITQGSEGRAQTLGAARHGFGALAGDFRLHGGQLFLFYAQQLSFHGDPLPDEEGILAGAGPLAAYCPAS